MPHFSKRTLRFSVICMSLLLLSATTVYAISPLPKKSGFSGFWQPGVGYLSIKSNLVSSAAGIDFSKEKITSLDNKPKVESSASVRFPFKLAYTFDNLQTQVFLGAQLEDVVRFDMVQQLGVTHNAGAIGVVQASLLFSSLPTKVWEDPFVVNVTRQETDRSSLGGQIVLGKAFGSNFELLYSYRNIKFDKESSGQFLGLSSADRKLLDRNRKAHKARIRYNYQLDTKNYLIPSFTYRSDNGDGKAISGSIYYGQLTYRHLGDPVSFMLNVGIGKFEADKANPIYSKTEESDLFDASAFIYYKNPWGWQLFGSKPLQFVLSGAYALADSNINFYTQELSTMNLGVIARW